ncbi:MAG: FAD:protein FMN transferase [Clostridiales bacterium]|nr:FAD:protein FMN transferase [Clostridiales bacterium]
MKKKTIICILLAALLIAGCTPIPDENDPFAYYAVLPREVFATGIEFYAAVRGGDEQAALSEMSQLMDDLNSDMSLTLSSSALSRFNALGAGVEDSGDYQSAPIEISAETYAVIERARVFYGQTNGAFNIAVRPLTALWHVDNEGIGEYMYGVELPPIPSYDEVTELLVHCDLNDLHTETDEGKYYIYKTDPLLRIDLGAIAKGYAADRCVAIAKAHGVESALINISGNICVVGEWYHPKKKVYVRWDIGVNAPRPRGGFAGEACALSVPADCTVVTSGDYRRYITALQGDTVLYLSHIVNGVSGLPQGIAYDSANNAYVQQTDFVVSAVIFTDDSTKADAYATAACLMSYEQAIAFLREHNTGGILFTEDKRIAFIGITESDESGKAYVTQKEVYSAYRSCTVEEYALD